MILAWNPPPFRETRSVKRNLRLAKERIPAKIISAAIPHASSSNPAYVSRRATHTLVSTFSRAAIFPRTVPFLPSFRPYRGYVTSYKPSPFRTGKAHCFVARDPRGAIVVSAPSCPILRSFVACMGLIRFCPSGTAQGKALSIISTELLPLTGLLKGSC